MHISELDTPALLIDLDVFEQNLRKVQLYADRHGLRLRPHTKTHKSPEVARQQLALGAAGLTVAKVSEAEVLAGALAKTAPFDLLVAFPVIGAQKLERLVRVARQTPVTVALDSEAAARPLSDAAHAESAPTAWPLLGRPRPWHPSKRCPRRLSSKTRMGWWRVDPEHWREISRGYR